MKRNTLNTFITATLVMLLGVSSSASAQTIVPMGDLMGTTSVTFGEGIAAVTYSSALKVDLVPKAPVLSSIERQTLGDAKSATATFSITSRANGPADYTLKYDVKLTNLEGPEPGVTAPLTIENLGATAVVNVNEDRRLLSVPSDGVPDDAEVNGIKATDKVMIDNLEYRVEAVEDDGAIATIRLANPLPDGASSSMGTPIWEKQQVTVTLAEIGNVEEEGLPSNVTVTVTASYEGLSDDTTFIASRTVEVLPWARTYVRNTDEEKNPKDAAKIEDLPEENKYRVGEKWYFSSLAGTDSEAGLAEADYVEDAQVRAAAGDTLEYVIVVSAGNTLDEQQLYIKETFPPFAIEGSLELLVSESDLSTVITEGDDTPVYCDGRSCGVSGTIRRNQSARLVYTLQLGEAEEVESEDLGEGGVSPEVTTSEPGTPWVEGDMLVGDTACYCYEEDDWADYCRDSGWAAGVNGYDMTDKTSQVFVEGYANTNETPVPTSMFCR